MKKAIQKIRYYLLFSPITINALLVGIALLCCYLILNTQDMEQLEKNSFSPLVFIMAKTAFLFFASIVCFSIVSALINWFLFLIRNKKNNQNIRFEFEQSKKNVTISTFVKSAYRPFLGFVKARVVLNHHNISDSFILGSNKRSDKKFWREGIFGKSQLRLNDVQNYQINECFIFFEDMLQLFSLPVRTKVNSDFINAPKNKKELQESEIKFQAVTDDIRIEELKRIQGDYIQYKDFEHGDDIRRIVWKVYAKNKELVVRIPEPLNPYASHVNLYASYYNSFLQLQMKNPYIRELLNYYKNTVYTIYHELFSKEVAVNYITQQHQVIQYSPQAIQKVQEAIAAEHWQRNILLGQYYQTGKGSILIISSTESTIQLRDILSNMPAHSIIYYIKLSRHFRSFAPLSWVARVFFQTPSNHLKRLKAKWPFSTINYQLKKKEKEIKNILIESGVSYQEI